MSRLTTWQWHAWVLVQWGWSQHAVPTRRLRVYVCMCTHVYVRARVCIVDLVDCWWSWLVGWHSIDCVEFESNRIELNWTHSSQSTWKRSDNKQWQVQIRWHRKPKICPGDIYMCWCDGCSHCGVKGRKCEEGLNVHPLNPVYIRVHRIEASVEVTHSARFC